MRQLSSVLAETDISSYMHMT